MKKTLKKTQGFTLVEIMIVVAIIGLLAAIGIPSFIKAREKSLANTKAANIKQIEGAIEQYAFENGLTNEATVTWAQLSDFLKNNNLNSYDVGGETIGSFEVGSAPVYQ
ncbi:MAG: prepilin-type N-terminal cleavage/methylation domain-containing protein [Spartobacteria bacterium]|nr:prepilin-type N-terminal cleavage/methylation domain-containing protein [Spartobacteria bacterium]